MKKISEKVFLEKVHLSKSINLKKNKNNTAPKNIEKYIKNISMPVRRARLSVPMPQTYGIFWRMVEACHALPSIWPSTWLSLRMTG